MKRNVRAMLLQLSPKTPSVIFVASCIDFVQTSNVIKIAFDFYVLVHILVGFHAPEVDLNYNSASTRGVRVQAKAMSRGPPWA